MNTTRRLFQAISVAADLHRSQVRKTNGVPYVSHLYSVCAIVSEYTDDEDVLIAALMHDTVEDVEGFTPGMLKDMFGEKVAYIVEGVTQSVYKADKSLPREERIKLFEEMQQKDLERTEQQGYESILVSAADKLHNLTTMVEEYKINPEMLNNFRQPLDQMMGRFRKYLEMYKRNLDNNLPARFEEILKEAEAVFPL